VGQEDRYRLAPLRNVRERDERAVRGDLAAKVGDARETQARVEAARARTVAARTALTEAVSAREHSATAAQLAAADRFIARRRRELDDAIGEELRAELAHEARIDHVDEARARLARARADRQIIERHFERWRDARRKLADRRED